MNATVNLGYNEGNMLGKNRLLKPKKNEKMVLGPLALRGWKKNQVRSLSHTYKK